MEAAKQLQNTSFLPMIERQIEQSESQGALIRSMFEGMKNMQEDVSEKFEEVKGMVQEVRDSITLTDTECFMLQSAVKSKAIELTKDRHQETDGKFQDVVGKHMRFIWSKLKRQFKVAKYSHIRRIDFYDAKNFVNGFVIEDFL